MSLFSGVADVSGFRHATLDAFPGRNDQLTGTQDTNSYAVFASNANVIYRVGSTRNAGIGKGSKSTGNGRTWVVAFDPTNDPVLPADARLYLYHPETGFDRSGDGGATFESVRGSGLPYAAPGSGW